MAVLHVAAGFLILAGCGGDAGDPTPSPGSTTAPAAGSTTAATGLTPSTRHEGCADVIAVELEPTGDRTYRVSATVSSADTGEEKYADEWRIVGPDGAVLGVRVLTHPHVTEQPFTRSLAGVAIPDAVETVTLEARDSVEGYCGRAVTVPVP